MVIAVTGRIRPDAVKDIHLQLGEVQNCPASPHDPTQPPPKRRAGQFELGKFAPISDLRRNSTFYSLPCRIIRASQPIESVVQVAVGVELKGEPARLLHLG